MKKILFILLLCPVIAMASVAGDIEMLRRWLDGGQGVEAIFIPEPPTSSLIFYDRPNRTFAAKQIGTGIDCSTAFCNVTGGTGAPGMTGPAGTNGASAYEIAVANGFVGSQAAWLLTLKGATGSTGLTGLTGPNGSDATTKAVIGSTVKNSVFRVYQNATVVSGVAVFQLTSDGTGSGVALFANEVFTDSVSVIVNDATASYQMGWVFSNSNKTLTVTANKLSTANILTGVLGQSAANGAVVKLMVEGR